MVFNQLNLFKNYLLSSKAPKTFKKSRKSNSRNLKKLLQNILQLLNSIHSLILVSFLFTSHTKHIASLRVIICIQSTLTRPLSFTISLSHFTAFSYSICPQFTIHFTTLLPYQRRNLLCEKSRVIQGLLENFKNCNGFQTFEI